MSSVRVSVAVADALPFASPAPGPPADAGLTPPPPGAGAASTPAADPAVAAPLHPAAAAIAAAPRGGGLRGRVSALLRRPAEYARAYLTASVEHQLRLQAERTADLTGGLARLEGGTARLEAALVRTDAALDDARRREDAEAERTSSALDALSRRLAHLEDRQGRLGEAVTTAAAVGAATAADQIALGRRNAAAGEHAVARLDQVLGVLGPRFDELEIKVRPLVEIDAESVAVRTADSYVMLPRSEPLFVTAVANATSGGLEPGTRRVLRALLRPGDACADVGANVGLLTVAMAFAVGPAGRVWAFEPEARVRAQLARTLHLNGLSQVALSGRAVGAEAGRLTFHQSPIIGHSSLYALPDDEQADERAVEVEVTTLDAVVPPGTALAAVKIDVEGAELDVLAGMSRVIADSPALAVVAEFGPSHLRRVGVTPEAWFAAFAAHGLEPQVISEPDGATSSVAPGDLAQVESANLVFVRPGGGADGRLPR